MPSSGYNIMDVLREDGCMEDGIIGYARVVCDGFDTDRMMRFTVFEFDPPIRGESIITHFSATISDDGLPMPADDWMVREDRERFVSRLGYVLVG